MASAVRAPSSSSSDDLSIISSSPAIDPSFSFARATTSFIIFPDLSCRSRRTCCLSSTLAMGFLVCSRRSTAGHNEGARRLGKGGEDDGTGAIVGGLVGSVIGCGEGIFDDVYRDTVAVVVALGGAIIGRVVASRLGDHNGFQ